MFELQTALGAQCIGTFMICVPCSSRELVTTVEPNARHVVTLCTQQHIARVPCCCYRLWERRNYDLWMTYNDTRSIRNLLKIGDRYEDLRSCNTGRNIFFFKERDGIM
jgi:hypothetical protein